MMKIEINTERWNQASGGKRRVMLNKWFWPCIYPNGYRWTPFVLVQPVKIRDAPKPPDSFTKAECRAAVRAVVSRRVLHDRKRSKRVLMASGRDLTGGD